MWNLQYDSLQYSRDGEQCHKNKRLRHVAPTEENESDANVVCRNSELDATGDDPQGAVL